MSPTVAQDAVFAFLAEPATHGGKDVRRIDTHAASVFLAGDRAYKVKRAVRFPFLDYSSLEKRKAACVAELDVNKPFASELYLRIVPVTCDTAGQFALGGNGEPVEWAVEMARFDESQTLDHVADARGIDDALAEDLAAMVLRMQDKAPAADAPVWIDALESYIGQNTAAFAGNPDVFEANAATRLADKSRAALQTLRPLLLKRGKLGLVRRGHGDLHLGNVALIDGKPLPFDAIEFDPVVASGDVLYDLGFLLMDLVERRLGRAANIVFNRYFASAARLDDIDALAALPFFMSLRAAIRAMTTAARLPHAAAEKQEEIKIAARTYFRLANDLMAPQPPSLIAVGGLSGTGKSVLARALASHVPPAPGALVFRSDVERKRLFNVGEAEPLPPDAYQPQVSAAVYRTLHALAARTLAAGHSAIVDAVYATPKERAAAAAIVQDNKARFFGLFLVAELATRVSRVGARTGDASDADAEVARQQEAIDHGEMNWQAVNANGSPDDTLERARRALG
jgi:aminoglycoside phosphotransferase family enzyme/predicted kinase